MRATTLALVASITAILGVALLLQLARRLTATLWTLRAREIAAVLVNPVQSFHPNTPPPNDAVLLTSDARKTEESREP